MAKQHGAKAADLRNVIRVRERRPTRVSTIGWFWVIAGTVKAISLALYLRSLGSQLGNARDTDLALRSAPSWFEHAASFLFGHLGALGAFWVTLGVFMVFAGASVLRRRHWARLGLELVCWFGLLEAPFVGAFLYFTGRAWSSHGFPGADRLAAQLFEGVWICAGWLAVYAVFLGLVRGAVVRSWLAGETA